MTRSSSSADARAAIHLPRLRRIALRSPEANWKILYRGTASYFKNTHTKHPIACLQLMVSAFSVPLLVPLQRSSSHSRSESGLIKPVSLGDSGSAELSTIKPSVLRPSQVGNWDFTTREVHLKKKTCRLLS